MPGMSARFHHEHGLGCGCDGLHFMCCRKILDATNRHIVHGMRGWKAPAGQRQVLLLGLCGWLDHQYRHRCRCKLVHAMRRGQVLDEI